MFTYSNNASYPIFHPSSNLASPFNSPPNQCHPIQNGLLRQSGKASSKSCNSNSQHQPVSVMVPQQPMKHANTSTTPPSSQLNNSTTLAALQMLHKTVNSHHSSSNLSQQSLCINAAANTNSLSSAARFGNTLASAVFLRNAAMSSNISSNHHTADTSRLLPFFMTTPAVGGTAGNQFNDHFSAASNFALLNPFAMLHDEPKPSHSYIGLIALAVLSSPEKKLVLSDIYQYILDNYPYFRTRGPGWKNSIRHNLSLNDCFIKSGRSANGKGHYWAIHPACRDDFTKGDFRRRHAQRKVRKAMGLHVGDEESDGGTSPSPVAVISSPNTTSANSFSISSFPSRTQPLVASTTPASTIANTCTSKSITKCSLKREHDESMLEELTHVSDLSPIKPNISPKENSNIGNNLMTPPLKKRQKRCFNIDSLLSPDCDDNDAIRSDNDEHRHDSSN